MVEIKNLTKSFGGICAVDHCSLSVQPKKITALIGPNGAGKTTLFDCISGLHEIDSGSIYFLGQEIHDWPVYDRALSGLARTFQLVRAFKNLTVKENLLLALDRRDQFFWPSFFGWDTDAPEEIEKIQQTLRTFGLEETLEVKTSDLSYGQQKLLSIARALVQPHVLILLDEPVAGVNPKLREDLKIILKKLRDQGETLFVIEHDMEFIMDIADQVIVMNEGKVLREGTPAEIQKDPAVLEVYLGK